MKRIVYIPQDIEDEGKDYLIEKGYELKIGTSLDKGVLMNEVAGCDAILTRSNAMIDKDVIAAASNVKIIAKYGVGLDNIDIQAATAQGIYVTNTPEANANAVAEHAMAFLLALSKKLFIVDAALRLGNFDIRRAEVSVDIENKVLGIIGLGRIGNLVAKKAHHGFGMQVIGYDPFVEKPIEEISKVENLDDIFRQADFISLHMPLVAGTRGIIGKEQFELMKQSAYFINAARGGVVKEADLVAALKENQIAGAAVDVFEIEPPLKENELFTLDNVIVTPHSAALSVEGSIRMAVDAATQVHEAFEGLVPKWIVNGKELVK